MAPPIATLRLHLWAKYRSLKDALDILNTLEDSEELPDLEGSRRNISLEMTSTMDLISNIHLFSNYVTSPIPFPTSDEIRRLRTAVGRLQDAVGDDADAVTLITVATEVVNTWPISDGG